MISICIPIYNFNVTALVNELHKQSAILEHAIEIIFIDDASSIEFKLINRDVCSPHKYIELPENIGRARIRNQFLNYAQYPYLLFLDCDSLIESPDFLKKYIECINEKPLVVCGGREFKAEKPARCYRLRWKYGKYKESQASEIRKKAPNRSFMTNNFLIDKNLFATIRFDERLREYGHEDTLFGFELKKENISIAHIHNPVVNGDSELNSVYLSKTKNGIENLVKVLEYVNYNNDFINDISLIRYYYMTQRLTFLITGVYAVFKPSINFLLKQGFANLYLFDFYKLGELAAFSRILNSANLKSPYLR